jgi:Bacteriophage Lambda NinG protein
MSPNENPTNRAVNQEGRRKRLARRPRMRLCLLKGCEQRFHPRQARQRYCSERCREAARRWSRRKAQQRYRATRAGQQKRNGQGQRYRERIRNRKPPEPEAVSDPARVITNEEFFRSLLRPAGLLRRVRAGAAKSHAALLFARLPTRNGTCLGTGAALERSARLNPDILIQRSTLAYIQPV